MALDVLVVDDETDIRGLIVDILKEEGYQVRASANSTQVFDEIKKKVPNAIILDVWLQGSELDGLGILEVVKKRYPLMPVIVISGHGTIETAVNAIKLGAYDYLEKPFTEEKLMVVLRRACEVSKLRYENMELRSRVVEKNDLIGVSSALNKLKSEIDKVSQSSSRLILYGPTGCGKELSARLIHKKSKRSAKPFIKFSPALMSGERIKEELFGLTNKVENNIFNKRITILEAANGGTLYIDEVTALPERVQLLLLEFLQKNKIDGPANESKELDVRIICSTSRDILSEIQKGNFIEELYYRLNVISIKIPLLSERKDDIGHLVDFFIRHLIKSAGLRKKEFSQEAISLLENYHWPGNIRQLKNVVEWILIMSPNDPGIKITPDMLPSEIRQSNNLNVKVDTGDVNLNIMSMPLREARELFEKHYLAAQMNRFNHNISRTSAFIGMERSALHRKLKTLNLHNRSVSDSGEELSS